VRTDVYQKITDQIVVALEQGVRPWHRPWNVEHSAGRITRPLRGNGVPYEGINVVMLWSAAIVKGYAAPIWMTFKQAIELKASVRKGEHGSLVVYADKIIRTETNAETGEEAERAIPFMKGYTVFNVEQIDGLPEHFYGKPQARTETGKSCVIRRSALLICLPTYVLLCLVLLGKNDYEPGGSYAKSGLGGMCYGRRAVACTRGRR
jgi:antirestriction protein ArdC